MPTNEGLASVIDQMVREVSGASYLLMGLAELTSDVSMGEALTLVASSLEETIGRAMPALADEGRYRK